MKKWIALFLAAIMALGLSACGKKNPEPTVENLEKGPMDEAAQAQVRFALSLLLDRNYIERETTLTVNKQLKCEEELIELGALLRDAENPNRIAIGVNAMVAVITGEDTTKLKKSRKSSADEKAAKIEGIKSTMKKALVETDPEVRAAYERWIDGMIDAANCRFTKAVVQVFEKTITEYTTNKAIRLKIIEIATTNSYKDATWAINKLDSRFKNPGAFIGVPQKQNVGIDPNSVF